MPARWRCKRCKIEFNGDGASRHYLAYPKHKLEKLPPVQKNVHGMSSIPRSNIAES